MMLLPRKHILFTSLASKCYFIAMSCWTVGMGLCFRIWIQLSLWFLWSRMEGRDDKRWGWGASLIFVHLKILVAASKLSDLYVKFVKTRSHHQKDIVWIFVCTTFLWNECYVDESGVCHLKLICLPWENL